MSESQPERRREQRYRLNKMLGVQLAGGEFNAALRIFVLDISVSGMRVTTPEQLPEQQDLEVTMQLPDRRPAISGKLAVRWQRFLPVSGNHEAGIEFLELSSEGWNALRDYIMTELSKGPKEQENLVSPWRFGKFPH